MLPRTNHEQPSITSWIHFGDLHIEEAEGDNYRDFLELIEEANQHLAGEVDFALLPGDSAENGEEEEYRLVRKALDGLTLAVHTIPGDHDIKTGTLDHFQRYLETQPFRAMTLHGLHLLFLNALDGADEKKFDLSCAQVQWFEGELQAAQAARLRPIVFTHLYPSELESAGRAVSQLIRNFGVELVEMGHTHYNELANDGYTIYAATRSTGQIEEGPPGFSLTTIDGDVISWKFKERGPWPFVTITSPSEEQLITGRKVRTMSCAAL